MMVSRLARSLRSQDEKMVVLEKEKGKGKEFSLVGFT